MSTSVSTTLANLWAEILHLPAECIKKHDNFFLLGGDSLTLAMVLGRINSEYNLDLGYSQGLILTSLAKLTAHVEKHSTGLTHAVQESGKAFNGRCPDCPASAAQQGLWFLTVLYPQVAELYNLAFSLDFKGHLDKNALSGAWAHVRARHESLRTGFIFDHSTGQLRQKIRLPAGITLDCKAMAYRQYPEFANKFIHQPFDLSHSPWRMQLVRHELTHHSLLVCMHHIISDGWSGALLLAELQWAYAALKEGTGNLPSGPSPVQYRQFSRWQHEQSRGNLFRRQRKYWRRVLDGVNMKASPHRNCFTCVRQRLMLPARLVSELPAFAVSRQATPFMVLLSLYFLLLSALDGDTDLTVGAPVANRKYPEWENIIGYLVNVVVLRCQLDEKLPYTKFLARVRQVVAGAFSNQELPLQEVAKLPQVSQNQSLPELFRYMFNYQNNPLPVPDFPGLDTSLIRHRLGICHYPLSLEVEDTGKHLALEIEYHQASYDDAHIRILLTAMVPLLQQVMGQPETRLADLQKFFSSRRTSSCPRPRQSWPAPASTGGRRCIR